MTSQQQAAKQDAQGLHDRLAALQQAQKEGGLALAEQLAQVKAKMQASGQVGVGLGAAILMAGVRQHVTFLVQSQLMTLGSCRVFLAGRRQGRHWPPSRAAGHL